MARSPRQRAGSADPADPTSATVVDADSASIATLSTTGKPLSVKCQEQSHEVHKAESSKVKSTCTSALQDDDEYVVAAQDGKKLSATEIMMSNGSSRGLQEVAPGGAHDAMLAQDVAGGSPSGATGASTAGAEASSESRKPSLDGDDADGALRQPRHFSGGSRTPDVETSDAVSGRGPGHDCPASGAGTDDFHRGDDSRIEMSTHASPAAYQARTPYGGDSDYLSGAATYDLKGVSNGGRQPAFEAAKRIVALYPYQVAERTSLLRSIGSRFSMDVHQALDPELFPRLQMKWRDGNTSLDPVGFTDADKKGIEDALGINFVNAGGRAGGIKAVHERLGLFLKFAFDQQGIYGSSRMAAKAAKREASASRWVHAMDSVHVSTPLLECVDIRVALTGGGHCTIRVQAFTRIDVRGCMKYDIKDFERSHRNLIGSRLPDPDLTDFTEAFNASVRSTTMRVGSADGRLSIHWDDEQLEDVVKPLAKHFFLSPGPLQCNALVYHSYLPASDAHAVSDASCDDPDTCAEGTHMSVLQFPGGSMDVSVVQAVNAVCKPSAEYFDNEAAAKLTGIQQKLAQQSFQIVQNGRADLRTQPGKVEPKHFAETTQVQDVKAIEPNRRGMIPSPTEFHLPFDVEVHQLPSGERMVLDTHRLLIPDVPWVQWMKSSEEAMPRVWVVEFGDAAAGAPRSGQLKDISTDPSLALSTWAEQEGIPYQFEPAIAYPELGCAVATAGGSSGSPGALAILSCPMWYYRGNVALTCLLPPEAAEVLQSSGAGDGCDGLCPDEIMRQIRAPPDAKHPELDHAEAVILQLYQHAEQSGPDTIIHDLAKSVADPVKDRTILKRAMHSMGLGLRHARNVLKGFSSENKVYRDRIICALAHGSDVVHDLCSVLKQKLPAHQAQQLAAMAGLFASKGLLCSHAGIRCGVQEKRSRPQDAGFAVVGAELATTGGIHVKSALDGLQSLLDELGHLQRVGGTAQGDLQNALCTLAQQSAGLRWIRPVIRARQAQEAFTGLYDGMSSHSLAGAAASGNQPSRPRYNPQVLCRLADIGETLVRRGKYMEAMQIYEFCCKRMSRQHADYSTLVLLMAKCFMKQRKLGAALDKFKECIELMPKDRYGYCELLQDASECYMRRGDSGDNEEAQLLCSQCVSKQLLDFNSEHPRYAIALSYQADVFSRLGEFEKAEGMYGKAEEILRSALGTDHPDYAKAIHRWGNCLAAQRKHRLAEETYRQCLEIRSKVLDQLHPDYITTLSHIATQVSWQAQGAMWEALELEEECRVLRAAVLGKTHPEYGKSLCHLLIYIDSSLDSSKELRAGKAWLSDESLQARRKEVQAWFLEYAAMQRLRTFIPILLSDLPCRVSTIRLAFVVHSNRLRHEVRSASSYGAIIDVLEELRQDGIVQTDLSQAILQRDYYMSSTAPPSPTAPATTAEGADGTAPQSPAAPAMTAEGADGTAPPLLAAPVQPAAGAGKAAPLAPESVSTAGQGVDGPRTMSQTVAGTVQQAKLRMLYRQLYASLESPSTSERLWALRSIAFLLVDPDAIQGELGSCIQEDALIRAVQGGSVEDPELARLGGLTLAMYRQAAGYACEVGFGKIPLSVVARSAYELRVVALLSQGIDWTFEALDRELSELSTASRATTTHGAEHPDLSRVLASLQSSGWPLKSSRAHSGTSIPIHIPGQLCLPRPVQYDEVSGVGLTSQNKSTSLSKGKVSMTAPGAHHSQDGALKPKFASISALIQGLQSHDWAGIAAALEQIDSRCRIPSKDSWSWSAASEENMQDLVTGLMRTATRVGITQTQQLRVLASLSGIASRSSVAANLAQRQGAMELVIMHMDSSDPETVRVAVMASRSVMRTFRSRTDQDEMERLLCSLCRPLARVCTRQLSLQVQGTAAGMLSGIANKNSEMVKLSVDAEDALPGLVRLLLRMPQPGSVAILLLRISSKTEADVWSFIRAGGLHGLAKALFSQNDGSVCRAAWLVEEIASGSPSVKRAISASAVLQGLAKAMGGGHEVHAALKACRVLLSDCSVAHRPTVQSGILAPLTWTISSVGHPGGHKDKVVMEALDIVSLLASAKDPAIIQALAGSGVLRAVSRCRKCSSFGVAVQANSIYALLLSQLVKHGPVSLLTCIPEEILKMPMQDERAVVLRLHDLVISRRQADSGIWALTGAGIMGVMERLSDYSDKDVARTAAGLLELLYADLETYHVATPHVSELFESAEKPTRGSKRSMLLVGLTAFAIFTFGIVCSQ